MLVLYGFLAGYGVDVTPFIATGMTTVKYWVKTVIELKVKILLQGHDKFNKYTSALLEQRVYLCRTISEADTGLYIGRQREREHAR
jgi:hypothetical protein